MDENTQKYQALLGEYRRVWVKVKALERRFADPRIILEQDEQRNKIHFELKKLANLLGKTSQDVDIDILINEKSLAEYKLPEFKIINLKELYFELDNAAVSRVTGGNLLHSELNEQTKINKEVLEDQFLFIPFGEEIAWHLFDHGDFLHREADNLEKRRRALALVAATPVGFQTEIRSFETFHRGINLFGVAFDKGDLFKIITALRENREAVSIAPEYLDEAVIEQDFLVILQDDIENIKSYVDPKNKEESLKYLLKTYRRNCVGEISNLSIVLKNKALEILDQEITNAELQELRDTVNEETEQELVKDEEYQAEAPKGPLVWKMPEKWKKKR